MGEAIFPYPKSSVHEEEETFFFEFLRFSLIYVWVAYLHNCRLLCKCLSPAKTHFWALKASRYGLCDVLCSIFIRFFEWIFEFCDWRLRKQVFDSLTLFMRNLEILIGNGWKFCVRKKHRFCCKKSLNYSEPLILLCFPSLKRLNSSWSFAAK